MAHLHLYLPQDRLRTLSRGEKLPDRTTGSALFADSSGFTPLTEALRETLDPRRGAMVLYPILCAPFDAALAVAKESLGEAAFNAAREAGLAKDAMLDWERPSKHSSRDDPPHH